MAVKMPSTLKASLQPEVLSQLDEALGPPRARRAEGTYELEVEAKGEGTFTLRYEEGAVSGAKGFADEPLLSAEIPIGGFERVARLLEAAAAGFPDAPELGRRQQDLKALPKADWDRMAKALERLKEMVLVIELQGGGTYRLARGPLDEATRELRLKAEPALLDRLLAGGNAGDLGAVKLEGERGLAAEIAAAFAPVVSALKR